MKPQTLLFVASLAAFLGACSNTPEPAVGAHNPATAPTATQRPAPALATTRPAAAARVTTATLPAHLDPKSDIASGRSVYFDFDEALLKSDFRGLVERHGRYLSSNPTLAIRIEGNADERGSAEYNLALGQRRAEAVRQALKIYGVKDRQLEVISWGEEKPRAKGNGESDWGQNRRADLQYPVK